MKMKRIATAVATVVVSAFALAACTTPEVAPVTPPAAPGETTPGEGGETLVPIQGGSVSFAMENTPNGIIDIFPNASNNRVIYLTQGPGFAFFDGDLNYVRNTDFGTFDLIEQTDGTMTVQYTINEGVQWSDGTPVDAADMILSWAAFNDRFDHVELGADGSVIPNDAVFTPGSVSMTTVSDFPVISNNGRTITFTYNDVRSDWYFQFGSSVVPAHIVARRALGIQDPMEAKQALISAFGGPDNYTQQDGTEVPTVVNEFNHQVVRDSEGAPVLDANGNTIPALADPTITTFTQPNSEELGRIAEVFNNDWFFNSFNANSDQDLTITQGPFRLVEWVEGEFMRLERNPNFTAYGNVVANPSIDEITIRFIGDPMAQVMALQNGEVDLIMPQTSVDTLAAIQGLTGAGISYLPLTEGAYEHVTLMMNNGGPFDPSHWGGNEDTARAVRQAFNFTLPRQDIIDILIRPLDPAAEVRNSFTAAPGAPAYAAITAGNESAQFNVQDLERARELLVDAGLEDQLPIPVRLLYANTNTRRANQFELIQAAAAPLFQVIDTGAPDWGTILRSGDGSFDAALFAWVTTSTSPNNSESNFITGGTNNIGGFHNAQVDALWAEITTTTDEARVTELTTEMERILFEEGFGGVIFQFPSVVAWRDNILNVSAIPIGMQNVWNFWDWQVAG